MAFFCMAFATSLTRVTDNKHHPTDVLAGALVGVAFQWFSVVCIMGLFEEWDKAKPMQHVPATGDNTENKGKNRTPTSDNLAA